jgi:hypothetical protein
MKKLSSVFLTIIMSFYGLAVMTPSLAFADNGSNHGGKTNHGSIVSAVARSHSEENGINHGSVVSTIAKNNHGHNYNGDNENENGNENNNEDQNENGNGNEHGRPNNKAFQITNIMAVPDASSSVISWLTSQPTLGTILLGTSTGSLVDSLSESGSLLLSHQLTLTGLIPDTTYFYAIRAQNSSSTASSTIVQSGMHSFHTLVTSTPVDITPPNILFSINLGLSASTTSLIWVTNEVSNSNAWISTTSPVATTTSPVASASALSFFHQLSIPNLATSTQYFYTVSSTDASGNTGFYSNSFTTPAI